MDAGYEISEDVWFYGIDTGRVVLRAEHGERTATVFCLGADHWHFDVMSNSGYLIDAGYAATTRGACWMAERALHDI